ncbi:MAG: hypothetical protein DSY91_03690 [Deltaproteobacteria bacterium]|nr:MAG: hypothetical protein DSY91_03690 [Deltaproteobacteria bacterium]
MKGVIRGFSLILVLMGFMLAGLSYAQENPPTLTLQQCLEIGLKNNLNLKASRYSIERAKSMAKAAHADFFPKLHMQGTYRWLDNPVKIDIPQITIHTPFGPLTSPAKTVSEAARNSGIWTTSIIQPLFTGGALTEQYKLAKLEAKREETVFENNRQALVEAIKDAYYELVKAEKVYHLAVKFSEQLAEHLKTAKAFLEESIIPLNDYLQTKVTLSNARLNVIKAKNGRKIAQSYLNLLLNRDINLAIRPEMEFPMPPLTQPLSYFQELALHSRPDLKSATARVAEARSAIRLAKSSYYPHVALSVNYRDLSDESFENDSASVLVTANWSIFEWNKRKWQVGAQRARLEQAILLESQLKQQILHEVKTAYLNVKESLKRVETIKDSVEQAKENLRINNLRYKEQVATSTDVIDAQTLLLRTEVNLTIAKIDYLKALAALEKAIGKPLKEDLS